MDQQQQARKNLSKGLTRLPINEDKIKTLKSLSETKKITLEDLGIDVI